MGGMGGLMGEIAALAEGVWENEAMGAFSSMKETFRSDGIRWGLQIVLWGGFWLLLPLLVNDRDPAGWPGGRLWLLAGLSGLLVATNVLLLFPQLYRRRRYLLYFLVGVGLTFGLVYLQDWIQQGWPEAFGMDRPRRGPGAGRGRQSWSFMRLFFRSFPLLLTFLGSAAIEITVLAQRQARAAIQLQKEKLESEVKWLRWQMNPHFLFNALNNIYSLTVTQSEQAPQHLLALSEMMRYMLYEGNKDRVPLAKELESVEKYVQLQLLKDSRGLNVTLDLPPLQGQPQIVPQLLLPFVENAFKHSNIEDRERGWIRIQLMQPGPEQIRFEVTNSVPAHTYAKDRQGGLGLQNVQRLLALMYPEKYDLRVDANEERYAICLDLTLN